MSFDVPTAVTMTIAVLGFFVALATYLRGGKTSAKEDGENDGRVLARLDSIDNGIRDIKAENRAIRSELTDVRDMSQHALDRAEAAHARIDRAGIDTH